MLTNPSEQFYILRNFCSKIHNCTVLSYQSHIASFELSNSYMSSPQSPFMIVSVLMVDVVGKLFKSALIFPSSHIFLRRITPPSSLVNAALTKPIKPFADDNPLFWAPSPWHPINRFCALYQFKSLDAHILSLKIVSHFELLADFFCSSSGQTCPNSLVNNADIIWWDQFLCFYHLALKRLTSLD